MKRRSAQEYILLFVNGEYMGANRAIPRVSVGTIAISTGIDEVLQAPTTRL